MNNTTYSIQVFKYASNIYSVIQSAMTQELEEDEDLWHVYFSERAQREYYYNPKTKIVTWILPRDETFELLGGEVHEQHQNDVEVCNDDEVPRGVVVIDSNEIPSQLKATTRTFAFSFVKKSTVIILFVFLIVYSWRSNMNSDVDPESKSCDDASEAQSLQPLLVCLEQRSDEVLAIHRTDHLQEKERSSSLFMSSIRLDYHDESWATEKEVRETLPDIKSVHISQEGIEEKKTHSITEERLSHALHGNEDRIPGSLNHSIEDQKEVQGPSHPEPQLFPTKDVGENSPDKANSERSIACNIPLANVISRFCRRRKKDNPQPLFDIEALVDALVA